jgi:hypothetical protein
MESPIRPSLHAPYGPDSYPGPFSVIDGATAASLAELQQVLDETLQYYNDVRPHQSRGQMTPRAAYDGRAKMPRGTLINQPHYRIRRDTVDQRGHVTLRYPGQLRHLNVGWKYRGDRVRLSIVDDHVDIVTEAGERVGAITLNPDKDYQSMTRRASTKTFAGSSVRDVSKHHSGAPSLTQCEPFSRVTW